jgi:hypothetical protein
MITNLLFVAAGRVLADDYSKRTMGSSPAGCRKNIGIDLEFYIFIEFKWKP